MLRSLRISPQPGEYFVRVGQDDVGVTGVSAVCIWVKTPLLVLLQQTTAILHTTEAVGRPAEAERKVRSLSGCLHVPPTERTFAVFAAFHRTD